MNILQVQDALKNASDQQLAGELQNPTGMAPSYLVLSELKRRQQMRQGSQAAQAPQGSMAEEAASNAEPEYYPEEQPQEEVPGIEAFREGGVVRMQAGGMPPMQGGGLPVFRPMPSGLSRSTSPRLLDAAAAELSLDPSLRTPAMIDNVARQYGIEPSALAERLGVTLPSAPEQPAATPSPTPAQQPAARAAEVTPPPEGQPSNELYGPPAPPPGQPAAAPSPTRAGAGIGAVVAQPAPQQEEGISSLYGRLRELSPSREEYRRDAVNNALMQAGLAMMASKDPNALANLGAGGLRGLQTYTEEMKTGRAQQRQAIADEITARRANTEELYRRGLISNQERQLRLMEARIGQAAADRAETREMNREMRLEQINQRNVAALNSSLTSYASEINRLQIQLDNMTASDTRRQGLMNRLNQLQNETNIIRRRLAQAGGAEFDVVAPTQNPNAPPPGAPVEPLRIPGTR